MKWYDGNYFQIISIWSAAFTLVIVGILFWVLAPTKALAQTCPRPGDHPDWTYRDPTTGKCIRPFWFPPKSPYIPHQPYNSNSSEFRIDSATVPIHQNDPIGSLGGAPTTVYRVSPEFDKIPIFEEISFGLVARGEALEISYENLWPNREVEIYLVRYHPALESIELLFQSTITLDAQGEFTDDSIGAIPSNVPGRDYRLITCALDDCSLASVLANLDSVDVKMNKFELDPLGQFPYMSATTTRRATLTVPFNTTGEQMSPAQIGFQLSKDNKPVVTTQELLQYCNPASKDACEASLNQLYPYWELDAERGVVEIFSPDTYLKEKNSAWKRVPTRAFGTGTYELQVYVNGMPEDVTTVEVTCDDC